MDLFEEKTKRLIITHIVNENFKSFAGIQQLGPFHKSFTSIVGPNGSGKSNVIDSILFVFGYRSSKIRSKKLSHLIHKSENHADCKQCTVAIHFARIDEANNDQVLEKFVISRTARLDNTSDYYFNYDTKKTFKEIQQLLLSYDIDVEHNRFLILQGEVEQISLMKPKATNEHEDGILEYLEDIIGTNKFIEPINEIKHSLEELNDLRAEKYNRVKVTEKEKTNLEPARQQALEYIEKEKQRNRIKSIILLNKIKKVESDNEKLLSKKSDLDEQLLASTSKKDKYENELQSINSEIEALTNQLEPLTKCVDQLKRKIVQLEKDQTKQLQQEQYLKDKIEQLESEIKDTIFKQTEISSSYDKINKALLNLGDSKEKLQDELKGYEETYNTLMIDVKKSTKDLTREKAELDEVILKKNEEINKIKLDIDNLKSQCEELRANEKNIILQIKQREGQIKNIEIFLRENENNDKLTQIEVEKRNLVELKQRLDKIKAEESSLIDSYKEKHSSFDHIKVQRNNSKFKNKIVELLLKAQAKGDLKGIYGRMGDLAYIPPEYDCAVSTAFPSLDNILVENIDIANNCVEFLRQNNLGTSTFICLDKMKTWRSRVEETKNNFQTPNNVPRLFDLIQLTDIKFETAFYFIMRDTLVAKSMEEATSIAFQKKQRWRVVTLAGELVEKSGTMSGGGSRKTTGRMLTTLDKNGQFGSGKNKRRLSDLDVHKLEIEINTLKNKISDLKSEKSKLISTVESLSKAIPKKETELQKIYMEIDGSKNELVELNDQIAGLHRELDNVKPDEDKLDKLKSEISQKNQILDKANSALSKVKIKVDAVNEKISNISNKILQQVQFKMNSVTRLIEQVSGEISKNNAFLSNGKKQEEKLLKTLQSLNEEYNKNKQKLASILEKKIKNTMNDTITFGEQKNLIEDELLSKEKLLEQHKEKLCEYQTCASRLQTDIETEKMRLVDVRNDLDKISSQCSTAYCTITSIQKEIEQLNVPANMIEDWQQYSDSFNQLHGQLLELDHFLSENKVNLQVIDEYKEKVSVYMERVAELEEITQKRDKYRLEIESLYKQRLNNFMEGFSIINSKLKEFYRLITLGGDAELEFVDSLDPFVEGVVFSVRPPNKSWKVIGNLSGGEKTLSSLALVFALHYYRPSPFYVMDEIDAALDFKNVSIIANYIKERTKNAQFIIISLRNNMFELANVLVGIYKTDNCTKSIAVDPFKMITID